MDTITDKFWAKWAKANCLERHKLVETLPMFTNKDGTKEPFAHFVTATLLNSYLADLYEYTKHKAKQRETQNKKQAVENLDWQTDLI